MRVRRLVIPVGDAADAIAASHRYGVDAGASETESWWLGSERGFDLFGIDPSEVPSPSDVREVLRGRHAWEDRQVRAPDAESHQPSAFMPEGAPSVAQVEIVLPPPEVAVSALRSASDPERAAEVEAAIMFSAERVLNKVVTSNNVVSGRALGARTEPAAGFVGAATLARVSDSRGEPQTVVRVAVTGVLTQEGKLVGADMDEFARVSRDAAGDIEDAMYKAFVGEMGWDRSYPKLALDRRPAQYAYDAAGPLPVGDGTEEIRHAELYGTNPLARTHLEQALGAKTVAALTAQASTVAPSVAALDDASLVRRASELGTPFADLLLPQGAGGLSREDRRDRWLEGHPEVPEWVAAHTEIGARQARAKAHRIEWAVESPGAHIRDVLGPRVGPRAPEFPRYGDLVRKVEGVHLGNPLSPGLLLEVSAWRKERFIVTDYDLPLSPRLAAYEMGL